MACSASTPDLRALVMVCVMTFNRKSYPWRLFNDEKRRATATLSLDALSTSNMEIPIRQWCIQLYCTSIIHQLSRLFIEKSRKRELLWHANNHTWDSIKQELYVQWSPDKANHCPSTNELRCAIIRSKHGLRIRIYIFFIIDYFHPRNTWSSSNAVNCLE